MRGSVVPGVQTCALPISFGEFASSVSARRAARAAARRALTLDANSPNAQFVLADSARVGYAFVDAETRYRSEERRVGKGSRTRPELDPVTAAYRTPD